MLVETLGLLHLLGKLEMLVLLGPSDAGAAAAVAATGGTPAGDASTAAQAGAAATAASRQGLGDREENRVQFVREVSRLREILLAPEKLGITEPEKARYVAAHKLVVNFTGLRLIPLGRNATG